MQSFAELSTQLAAKFILPYREDDWLGRQPHCSVNSAYKKRNSVGVELDCLSRSKRLAVSVEHFVNSHGQTQQFQRRERRSTSLSFTIPP